MFRSRGAPHWYRLASFGAHPVSSSVQKSELFRKRQEQITVYRQIPDYSRQTKIRQDGVDNMWREKND